MGKTDHLDVWLFHEVVYYNDPELIFAPAGVAEALLSAKQQGKVRLVGCTGHKDPAIHLRMLAIAGAASKKLRHILQGRSCWPNCNRW